MTSNVRVVLLVLICTLFPSIVLGQAQGSGKGKKVQVSVTSSANPSAYGELVTFTVTVTPAAVGELTFDAGSATFWLHRAQQWNLHLQHFNTERR